MRDIFVFGSNLAPSPDTKRSVFTVYQLCQQHVWCGLSQRQLLSLGWLNKDKLVEAEQAICTVYGVPHTLYREFRRGMKNHLIHQDKP